MSEAEEAEAQYWADAGANQNKVMNLEKTQEMMDAEAEDMEAEMLAKELEVSEAELPTTERPRPLLARDEYVYIMNAIRSVLTVTKSAGRPIPLEKGHCEYLIEQFGKNLKEFVPARGLIGVCQHEKQPVKPHPEVAQEGLASLFG